jgi:hypothetical protein
MHPFSRGTIAGQRDRPCPTATRATPVYDESIKSLNHEYEIMIFRSESKLHDPRIRTWQNFSKKIIKPFKRTHLHFFKFFATFVDS